MASAKRPRLDADPEEEEEDELERHIDAANRLIKGRAWFVCCACNTLVLGQGEDLTIDNWGQQGEHCVDCIRYCNGCQEYYAPCESRQHGDCDSGGDDGGADEDDDEEESSA